MRQLKLYFLLLLGFFSLSTQASIQQRIAIYAEQVELFKQICFTPSGVFLQDKVLFDVKGSIRETVMDCNAQALALEEERQAIEAQMQKENCEEALSDQGLVNLLNGNSAIVSEIACPGIGNALDCTQGMVCNLVSSVVPMGSAIANLALSKNPNFGKCENGPGNSCLTNLGKAIWDNLWDTVTGIYDLAKMGVSWVGNKIGSLWKAEDATSNRGIAATEITDSELDKFLDDPVSYITDFGKKLIDMITQGISKRYGCAKWTGIPHVSECIEPMSWDCANCNEKMNMVCGVTGYVGATVVAAFFTGGASAAVQVSSRVAASTAITIAKAIPGAARLAETMSLAGKVGRVSSLISGSVKSLWGAVAASRTVQGISSVASKLKVAGVAANGFARKSVLFYATGQDAVINSVKAYNRLTVAAFNLGYRSTGAAANNARNFLYSQYPKLSDVTAGKYAGVTSTKTYLREATKDMSATDRASMRVSVTTDSAGEKRVIIHDTRADELKSDISYKFTNETPPQVAKTTPPLPIQTTNMDTIVVRGPTISDELEMIHGLGGKTISDDAAKLIETAMERRIAQGANVDEFVKRQIIVREALETSGFTAEEALSTAEKLFRSGALGRTPPPNQIAALMRRSPASHATDAEKASVIKRERPVASISRDDYIDEWAPRRATSTYENNAYIDLSLKGKDPGLFYLDTQNTALKRLNDTLRDKSLVDAFGNRYNNLVQVALRDFQKKYPDVTISMYSDYKSLRAAIRGPPGQEQKLMDELADMMDDVSDTFITELKANNLVDPKFQNEIWFRAGLGRSADEANLVTRFSRRGDDSATSHFSSSSIQSDIQNARNLSEASRQSIITRFEGSPMIQEVGSVKVPTAAVLEVVRKNSDMNDVAKILSGRYGREVTVKDAELLKQYFNQVDQFSPGLLISERVEHNFGNAVHGGFTVDFAGVGSVNAEATAIGLASGRNLEDAISQVRLQELRVTRDLDALKSRTQDAVRTVLDRHNIKAQITISGDDMLVVPTKVLTPEVRREVAFAQVRAQIGTTTEASGMRTSFFGPNIADDTARSIQATIGETIEKRLRKRLEGVLTQDELKHTHFAIDMKGNAPGTGTVGIEVISSKLSPQSKKIVDEEFLKAVQDINTELKNAGQVGTMNQTGSGINRSTASPVQAQPIQ